jgi:hypothetical protein
MKLLYAKFLYLAGLSFAISCGESSRDANDQNQHVDVLGILVQSSDYVVEGVITGHPCVIQEDGVWH